MSNLIVIFLKDNRKRFIFRCSDTREAEYWLESIFKCMNLYFDEKAKLHKDESKQAIQESNGSSH